MTTMTRYHRSVAYDDASLFPAPGVRTMVHGTVENPVLASLIRNWDEVLQECGPTDQPYQVTSQSVIRVIISNAEFHMAFTLAGFPGAVRVVPEEVWSSDTHAEEQLTPHAGLVQAVEWIADTTGLPQQDVIKASGLKKRTFHYWKNHPEACPRLRSQGDLWAVVQTVESLAQDLGSRAAVAKWIKADPKRRSMFTDGAHRRLAAIALDEAVQRGEYADSTIVGVGRRVPVGRFRESGDE